MMETKEYFSIAAVIIASLLAVIITKVVEYYQHKRQDRINIFKILASQYLDLTKEKVEVINLIEIVFYGRKGVINAYRQYREVLRSSQSTVDDFETKYLRMLEEMAKTLGYKKINWEIFKNNYKPDGVVIAQRTAQETQELCLEILRNLQATQNSVNQPQAIKGQKNVVADGSEK